MFYVLVVVMAHPLYYMGRRSSLASRPSSISIKFNKHGRCSTFQAQLVCTTMICSSGGLLQGSLHDCSTVTNASSPDGSVWCNALSTCQGIYECLLKNIARFQAMDVPAEQLDTASTWHSAPSTQHPIWPGIIYVLELLPQVIDARNRQRLWSDWPI